MAYTAPDNLTASDDFGFEEYQKLRTSIIANSHAEYALGGSRHVALPDGGGYKDAIEFQDFMISSADYGGATFEALVEHRVENAGISITPKIRNLTDASDAVVGSASTSTTGAAAGDVWASQTLAFTPVPNKRYRLMFVKSADTYAAWGVGKIRRTGT